jgi:hypothetical protein
VSWTRSSDFSIPDSIDELDRWSREYERTHLRYSDGSRRAADDTLGLFLARYPAPLRPLVRPAVLALLDVPPLDAFGYRHPPGWLRAILDRGLRLPRGPGPRTASDPAAPDHR